MKFTVEPTTPTVIEVQAHDGNTYVLETTLVIFEVTDMIKKNEAGIPEFQVKAQLITNTRRK